jgi:thiamine thiazole synthase
MIDDIQISKKIVEQFSKDFLDFLEVDVAIAGTGPSGLIAGYELAKDKKKVVIFERKLSVGGGMWGGGMMFPIVVLEEKAKEIFNELGIKISAQGKGYYIASSIECISKLCTKAIDAGVKIFNSISVEDVLIKENKINGFVINWSAVELANLHVDPLTIRAKYCIDATGHGADVCRIVEKKVGKLNTPSGKVEGERSMNAELGEKAVLENTKEVYPGLFVCGMAANTVFGAPRMGAIFGGMLLSGKSAALQILNKL